MAKDAAVADLRTWMAGARPRTLPAAIVPVLVGSGVAGIRGTDEVRVGPVRLVGSGLAKPRHVLAAALGCFAVACAAGLVLAAVTSWWLLLLGAAAVAAAWFYTGGSRPYGYRALGEVSVFMFFGLAAVAGTAYVQMRTLAWLPVAAAAAIGLLACALLVINNLRDIPTDSQTGKRTLAVVLGDHRTRALYTGCILVPFCVALGLAAARPLSLLALVALPFAFPPVRQVRDGATGRSLIAALGQTGRLQLAFGALLTLGLAVRI